MLLNIQSNNKIKYTNCDKTNKNVYHSQTAKAKNVLAEHRLAHLKTKITRQHTGERFRQWSSLSLRPGLEVIKLEFILRLKIKRNDWLLVDTCPQAANRCALF